MPSLLPATHVATSTSWARAISKTRRAARFLFPVAVLLACGASSVHAQSALDGFDPNANGPIYVIAVQPNGKILLGGDFSTISPNGGPAVTRNHIARLNPDGTLDTSFNPNADGILSAIVVQADGKILVGGQFTSIGGQARRNIARLDPTTGLADSFDPDASGKIQAIAVQADGRILVGGDFLSVGGQSRYSMARLDPTTGLAESFAPNPQGQVHAIVLQADRKILVGGNFFGLNNGGPQRDYIARLDPETGLADSFNPMANDIVVSIALQADGKILAGGFFTEIGGEARSRLARLDPTTGLADSFDPSANDTVWSIAVQADGAVLAGGAFRSIGGQTRNRIGRLNGTTGLADSFNPSASDLVASIAVQADGKILLGGIFTTLAPSGGAPGVRNHIARLETDGRLDRTIDLRLTTSDFVYTTVVQPDGKILIGGAWFSSVLGVARQNIARLNSDGTLDLTFDPNADSSVLCMAVQADGKILVGGGFTHIGGQPRNHIARIDPTTGQVDSFNPNADDTVFSILLQPDGKILVGGRFTHIGGPSRRGLARLDPATGQCDSFNPNPNFSAFAIALQADGKILVGGVFTSIGGQMRKYMARLDPTTGLADSFNPDPDLSVGIIVVQPDGKILVAGQFYGIGGQNRNKIARLDPTTGLADSFNPNSNDDISTIALQADGKILVGGRFYGPHCIGGQTRNYIARLNATNGVADSFNAEAANPVFSIVLQPDGKILAGGYFNTIGGANHSGFARLTNDTAARQNLAVTPTAITWTRGGSSPQLQRAVFEYSTNNLTYTALGDGAPAGNNWVLTGLSLPGGENFYIRARGYYRCSYNSGSESTTESVRNVFLPPAPQAINLSTRMRVEAGDNAGIAGFIITGTSPKHVLLRGLGRSLLQVGVPGVLADPVLELHGPGGFITVSNDNWRDDPTQAAAIKATGLAPIDDFESAIDATLNPGAYTAVIRGKNDSSGVAVVEAYDLSQSSLSKLGNISTRAIVSTGENIVIAGFMLGNHEGDDKIVVRGIGPSLAGFGISNALADPTLELRDVNGTLLVSNNDWQDDAAQAVEISGAGLAPGSNLEAAIAATLPPGPYTALLAGRNNGTGVGVVEVYDRGAP
jgi:uncharacterized delta-60 repeat protein